MDDDDVYLLLLHDLLGRNLAVGEVVSLGESVLCEGMLSDESLLGAPGLRSMYTLPM